jgi:pyruvate kinase
MSAPSSRLTRRHRRANIVATLGPATCTAERVRELALAGMDVARVNLAHGTAADHRHLCGLAHDAGVELGRSIAVLADIAGPKMRVDCFEGGSATLRAGQTFVISTEPCAGTVERVSTSYRDLARDVRPGNAILVDDGNIRLKVVAVDGPDVLTEVIEGGPISDHKGLNLPGVAVSAPPLSAEDAQALVNVLEAGVDLVALSFVRRPGDADAVRDVMAAAGRSVPVIAKIEKP